MYDDLSQVIILSASRSGTDRLARVNLFLMPKLAHIVYFTLKDRSPANVDALVAACKKYLDNHEGLIDFAVGVRVPDLSRPVNQDFDVSLHCVFADRAAHDIYQSAPRHLEFIAEQKDTWLSVQVFDSDLA